jgi:hypothetical protein
MPAQHLLSICPKISNKIMTDTQFCGFVTLQTALNTAEGS